MALHAMRTKVKAAALAAVLGPLLAGCLGFGGGEGEAEGPPPPQSSLMTGAAAKNPSDALPGQARPSTWTDAALAAEAAKKPKGPLDKSPTAFAAPSAPVGLPTLPGAAPPPGGAGATPAAAPAAAKPGPLPAGVNAAADGAPILDIFRKQKLGALITRVDDVYAERSAQLALEYSQDGAARGWTNPETGTTGMVRPVRTFQQPDGGYCREYVQAIQVRQKPGGDAKGEAQADARFACRLPSGRWKFLP